MNYFKIIGGVLGIVFQGAPSIISGSRSRQPESKRANKSAKANNIFFILSPYCDNLI